MSRKYLRIGSSSASGRRVNSTAGGSQFGTRTNVDYAGFGGTLASAYDTEVLCGWTKYRDGTAPDYMQTVIVGNNGVGIQEAKLYKIPVDELAKYGVCSKNITRGTAYTFDRKTDKVSIFRRGTILKSESGGEFSLPYDNVVIQDVKLIDATENGRNVLIICKADIPGAPEDASKFNLVFCDWSKEEVIGHVDIGKELGFIDMQFSWDEFLFDAYKNKFYFIIDSCRLFSAEYNFIQLEPFVEIGNLVEVLKEDHFIVDRQIERSYRAPELKQPENEEWDTAPDQTIENVLNGGSVSYNGDKTANGYFCDMVHNEVSKSVSSVSNGYVDKNMKKTMLSFMCGEKNDYAFFVVSRKWSFKQEIKDSLQGGTDITNSSGYLYDPASYGGAVNSSFFWGYGKPVVNNSYSEWYWNGFTLVQDLTVSVQWNYIAPPYKYKSELKTEDTLEFKTIIFKKDNSIEKEIVIDIASYLEDISSKEERINEISVGQFSRTVLHEETYTENGKPERDAYYSPNISISPATWMARQKAKRSDFDISYLVIDPSHGVFLFKIRKYYTEFGHEELKSLGLFPVPVNVFPSKAGMPYYGADMFSGSVEADRIKYFIPSDKYPDGGFLETTTEWLVLVCGKECADVHILHTKKSSRQYVAPVSVFKEVFDSELTINEQHDYGANPISIGKPNQEGVYACNGSSYVISVETGMTDKPVANIFLYHNEDGFKLKKAELDNQELHHPCVLAEFYVA